MGTTSSPDIGDGGYQGTSFDLNPYLEIPAFQEAALTEPEVLFIQKSADRLFGTATELRMREFIALLGEMDTVECELAENRKDVIAGLLTTYILGNLH